MHNPHILGYCHPLGLLSPQTHNLNTRLEARGPNAICHHLISLLIGCFYTNHPKYSNSSASPTLFWWVYWHWYQCSVFIVVTLHNAAAALSNS